jgi:mRNA interferase MazF
MVNPYVPGRGDVVWLDFEPHAGREPMKRRPALVLSPAHYNRAAGVALVCPITSREKGYPFAIQLPVGLAVQGTILSDQVTSFDWRVRRAAFITKASREITNSVIERLVSLLTE